MIGEDLMRYIKLIDAEGKPVGYTLIPPFHTLPSVVTLVEEFETKTFKFAPFELVNGNYIPCYQECVSVTLAYPVVGPEAI